MVDKINKIAEKVNKVNREFTVYLILFQRKKFQI